MKQDWKWDDNPCQYPQTLVKWMSLARCCRASLLAESRILGMYSESSVENSRSISKNAAASDGGAVVTVSDKRIFGSSLKSCVLVLRQCWYGPGPDAGGLRSVQGAIGAGARPRYRTTTV